MQSLSTKHRLFARLLVPGSCLALGHTAQSMAEGGQVQKEQAKGAAHHALAKWPLLFALGVPQGQPWVFTSYLPLSPGVRDSDCPLKAKYPCPRSLFGRWVGKELGRSWLGSRESSAHKTGGDIKPSLLEFAANIISWNHLKLVNFL